MLSDAVAGPAAVLQHRGGKEPVIYHMENTHMNNTDPPHLYFYCKQTIFERLHSPCWREGKSLQETWEPLNNERFDWFNFLLTYTGQG